MTEATFQAKLLRALRQHAALKDAVIWKLNADVTTKGMPDVMVSILGRTTFFELKCDPNEPTKIQTYYLRKLAPRAYVAKSLRSGGFRLYREDVDYVLVYSVEALAEEIVKRCVNG